MKRKEKTAKMELLDGAPSTGNINSLSRRRENFFIKEARTK
jgi:hypothetical protein